MFWRVKDAEPRARHQPIHKSVATIREALAHFIRRGAALINLNKLSHLFGRCVFTVWPFTHARPLQISAKRSSSLARFTATKPNFFQPA
jgi:hypothetical protein